MQRLRGFVVRTGQTPFSHSRSFGNYADRRHRGGKISQRIKCQRLGTEQMTLSDLRVALERAVKAENYSEAAQLRDMIRQVEEQDPLTVLRAELETAVREERYGDAALLRDQIKELSPPPPPSELGSSPLSTMSDKVTEGVRVQVQSFFVPFQSRPEASAYLFAYRVRITNESHPTTVKLVSRRWIITDAQGRVQEVKGQGVVGEQPELAPGQSFEYESACPLRSATGTMEGEYEMYSRVSGSSQWTTSFLVRIETFSLDANGPQGIE